MRTRQSSKAADLLWVSLGGATLPELAAAVATAFTFSNLISRISARLLVDLDPVARRYATNDLKASALAFAVSLLVLGALVYARRRYSAGVEESPATSVARSGGP